MEREKLLPIRILHDFADKIERLGINYMLTGSMAMLKYSVYRYTADIDVVVELKNRDAPKIIEIFEPDYYVPHDSVSRAISNRRMFNVIHQETAFKIDCVIKKTGEFQENAFNRRERTDFYGREIWIITKEDLILSKLWWAKDNRSEKQLTDVKNLLRNEIDTDYIENWAQKLSVSDLLKQCLAEMKK
ncbi:MAG: DUF6036 family nucleotidyltransferase [Pyrinomonadaceae bacterium]